MRGISEKKLCRKCHWAVNTWRWLKVGTVELYWSQKISKFLTRKSASFSKKYFGFKNNSKIIERYWWEEAVYTISFSCSHSKMGQVGTMKLYWSQKNFEVPNTKKCKIFEKHFEFRNKFKNIARYWMMRGSCVENFVELWPIKST